MLAGISVSLSKGGYDLNISIAPNSEHEIDSLRHMVQGKRVDGIILTLTKAVDELISYLLDQNFFLFCMEEKRNRAPHAFLDMDGELAFREACTFMIELGHKRIALINGEPEYMFPAFCSEGYRNGLKSGNLPFDPELVRAWRHRDGQLSSFQQTVELMQLSEPPTAIVFQTEAAADILQALLLLQLQVGKDIALIGYDDLEITKTNIQPLTTMRPPARNAGKQLVGMLIQIIDGRAAEDLQEV